MLSAQETQACLVESKRRAGKSLAPPLVGTYMPVGSASHLSGIDLKSAILLATWDCLSAGR